MQNFEGIIKFNVSRHLTIDIFALFYLMGLLYSNVVLHAHRKRLFLIGIVLTIVVILAEMGTVFTDGIHGYRIHLGPADEITSQAVLKDRLYTAIVNNKALDNL